MAPAGTVAPISIAPLLRSLRPAVAASPDASAADISFAVSNILADRLSPTQTAVLLYNMSVTGLEHRPDVLAQCAAAMRAAAVPVDAEKLRAAVLRRRQGFGSYRGGLCEIVGTGGDSHSTFNISTTASIICSALLVIAKHGNRAATSKSGSADVLAAVELEGRSPRLDAVTPERLLDIYDSSNYAFLFAPNFHPGLKHIAGLRKELPHPTIFNLLGPLASPVAASLEVHMLGVKRKDLVPVFAEALRLGGARKALVVCGAEDLDEISCAGPTHCALLVDAHGGPALDPSGSEEPDNAGVTIEYFTLTPEDFGLPRHPLSSVSPGLTAAENAAILGRILRGEMPADNPILHFVLLNAAALFAVAGVCDGDASAFGADADPPIAETGPGGKRWKQGVRLARQAVASGAALAMLGAFARATQPA